MRNLSSRRPGRHDDQICRTEPQDWRTSLTRLCEYGLNRACRGRQMSAACSMFIT